MYHFNLYILFSILRSNKQPTKTLEQREAEYAEARLRILGPTYNNSEDSPNVEEGMAEERSVYRDNIIITVLTMSTGPPAQHQ
jgi:hypothetical protein